MKELIKKRHLIPIAVWFVIYMGLFGFLEIVPPKEVHLIHCALDDMIPHMAVFIYPYVSWFPYIVVCAYLAIKNLDGIPSVARTWDFIVTTLATQAS